MIYYRRIGIKISRCRIACFRCLSPHPNPSLARRGFTVNPTPLSHRTSTRLSLRCLSGVEGGGGCLLTSTCSGKLCAKRSSRRRAEGEVKQKLMSKDGIPLSRRNSSQCLIRPFCLHLMIMLEDVLIQRHHLLDHLLLRMLLFYRLPRQLRYLLYRLQR